MSGATVRVVVIDDSPLCAEVLRGVIERDPRFHVEAVGHDGLRAVELARTLRPTIMTMDVHMPRMNGLDAVTNIMRDHPTRILLVTEDDARGLPFEALRRGALDLVRRPSPHSSWDSTSQGDFRQRLFALAQTPLRAPRAQRASPHGAPPREPPASEHLRTNGGVGAVALAASTGGPDALMTLLSLLPVNFPLPLLIVQHLAAGFVDGFAGWLDRGTELAVSVATDGAALLPGSVLVAPDGAHLTIDRARRVILDPAAPLDGHRPSATRLFESLASVFGARSIGVVLTGMGRDGADGIAALRAVGAHTIAQDHTSSIVDGMPNAAREIDGSIDVLPLDGIATRLVSLAARGSRRSA